MDDEDLVRTRNTRTGDARKIDEWTVPLPGGEKARFDVAMRYDHGICTFSVRSDHPEFRNVHPHDADLNRLREKLAMEARSVIADKMGEGWTPASMLEISHQDREHPKRSGNRRFSLNLTVRRVERRKEMEPGNLPVLTVRTPWQREKVVIRAHSEDFSAMEPSSGRLTDPEVRDWLSHPISRDARAGMGRVVTEGDGSAEARLIDALEAFSRELSDRLAPGRVAIEGIPAPKDLVALMQAAVSCDAEQDPGP